MSVPATATKGPPVQAARTVIPSATFVGPGQRRTPVVAGSVLIGRRPTCDIRVDDPTTSRVHARLDHDQQTTVLTDLGSTGGTYVNGEALNGPRVLQHGDEVRIGATTWYFEDPASLSAGGDPTEVFDLPDIQTGAELSPRQQQVLEGIADGLTNLEIGERLGVTERTIKSYASELFDKLGVSNRAEAVAEGARRELL